MQRRCDDAKKQFNCLGSKPLFRLIHGDSMQRRAGTGRLEKHGPKDLKIDRAMGETTE